jgi:GntR family transcriptional regulator/MocR family aminotransferase
LPNAFLLSVIHLDRTADQPLYRQIYDGIRLAIVNRQLEPGMRLPSSRDLADILDVSRNTIINAIDQLIAEGYMETRPGAGTYVTRSLPEDIMRFFSEPSPRSQSVGTERELSVRGRRYAQLADRWQQWTGKHYRSKDRVFSIGTPDLNEFPFQLWGQLSARHYRNTPLPRLGQENSAAGLGILREAIAEYLKTSRAVRCDPDQIIIVSGSQHALHIAADVLLDVDDKVWFEEPGYAGARNVFRTTGGDIIPIRVDDEGLDVDAGIKKAPDARLIYTTPSHQFPLGSTMSLARRFKLLDWAEQAGAWIIEDDYDSEFRYSGHPLASLQGLDVHNRVIYIGTFSKVLFPALRLGYMVVPPDLVGTFRAARTVMDQCPPVVPQAVVADFIMEGHFSRHIRRMRKLYGEKRDRFVDAVEHYLGDCVTLKHSEAGMHVTCWLSDNLHAGLVWQRACEHEIEVIPLSVYYCDTPTNVNGLMLGYTGASCDNIERGVEKLAYAVDEALQLSKQNHPFMAVSD